MNKQETGRILEILKGAYPHFYKDLPKSEASNILSLWQSMFADDDMQTVAMAVKAHIASDSKGFPPVIGQIKSRITQITQPKEMSGMEAWQKVKKALSNSAYNASEEFCRLPDIIQRIVGSPQMLHEWGQMDVDTVQSVVQSNFMRSFKAIQQSDKEYKTLPADVKMYIAEISGRLSMDRFIDNREWK